MICIEEKEYIRNVHVLVQIDKKDESSSMMKRTPRWWASGLGANLADMVSTPSCHRRNKGQLKLWQFESSRIIRSNWLANNDHVGLDRRNLLVWQ